MPFERQIHISRGDPYKKSLDTRSGFVLPNEFCGHCSKQRANIQSMDAQQQYLVYQQSESPSIPRSSQLHLAAAIAESQWHQSPTSNPPSAVSSQMYPILNRSSEIVDYTSSSPSSSFGPLDFHAGHQSPSIQTNHPNNAFPVDFTPQVESSIGPARGNITRRRTRIAHANQQGLSRCTEPEAEVRKTFRVILGLGV